MSVFTFGAKAAIVAGLIGAGCLLLGAWARRVQADRDEDSRTLLDQIQDVLGQYWDQQYEFEPEEWEGYARAAISEIEELLAQSAVDDEEEADA